MRTSPPRQLVFAWMLVLAWCAVGHAQITDELRRPLTRAERASLAEGNTVTRPVTERRGNLSLMGGISHQVIDLPVDAVWRALNADSSEYEHMLPKVESASETARDGNNTRSIRFTHEVGPVSAQYVMDFTYDHRRKIVQFRMDDDEPHTIRAGWGFLRLRAWSDDETLLTFGTMVDVGRGMITGLVRPTLHHWILRIPWTVMRHLHANRDEYVDEAG